MYFSIHIKGDKMKKIIISIIALAVIALGVWKYQTRPEQPISDKPVIKIGVIAPLTGNAAEFGENAVAAIEIAMQDFHPQNVEFEFIYEDYAFSALKAAVVANKLIAVDKVDALISWSSMAGSAVSPIADKNKVIHFSLSNQKNVAIGKYNFIHFSDSEALIDKFNQIVDKYNPQKVGMFIGYHPSLQQTANILEAGLRGKGVSVDRENFSLDHKDFNMMVDRAKDKNYDLLYIAASNPALDLLLKSFYIKQINKPITAIDAFNFTEELQLIEGAVYATTPDGRQDVAERVTAKTGSVNYYSVGHTYDVAKLLMEIYDAVGSNADAVAQALLNIKDYDSSVGKITVDADGVFHSDAVIKKIENGKRVLVNEEK